MSNDEYWVRGGRFFVGQEKRNEKSKGLVNGSMWDLLKYFRFIMVICLHITMIKALCKNIKLLMYHIVIIY